MSKPTAYQNSGVDIEKADQLVDWLKHTDSQRSHPFGNLLAGIGGFAACFEPQFSNFKAPVLVSSTDGIGTKLLWGIGLATKHPERARQIYHNLGVDLVAMCANDILCCGGQPLFFLDYFASGQLDLHQIKAFLEGVRWATQNIGALLIGGETAELPGLYQHQHFDAAGFMLGLVDRSDILGPHRVKLGDQVIALPSSGPHSNGYALLRKLWQLTEIEDHPELMAPTTLYGPILAPHLKKPELHAMAHITGGGWDNLLRVLPADLGCEFLPHDLPAWVKLGMERGSIPVEEVFQIWNCGIGLMLVVEEGTADQWCRQLPGAWICGRIQAQTGRSHLS